MDIYTLNVGQGNFTVVTGTNEAFIIDTHVPISGSQKIINVKAALATILPNKELIGLIITGFDADHFNEVGLNIVLNKYRPNWIMYPKYFKDTDNAKACFKLIDRFDNQNKKFERISVLLTDNNSRFYYKLSQEFTFEIFSPHSGDMTSSNNCSLVCKVTEKSTNATYLITGDTENARWDNILKFFGNELSCLLLAAPHHGSRNGVSQELLKKISPYKIIVSAGVDNSYGHPHSEAIALFKVHSKEWYQTNWKPDGQSIKTTLDGRNSPKSVKFEA